MFPSNGRVLVEESECSTGKVEFCNNSRKRGSLSTSECNIRQFTCLCERSSDCCVNFRIRFWNCNVVDKCDGFSTDAQQIVDVHCHTIDANTVPVLDCSCNLQFATNSICGHRQQMISKFNQSTKTARQVNWCSRCSCFSC